MGSLNKVLLLGRLGKDADVKTIGGSTVANFSLATDRRWRDKTSGELKKETDWHRISLWGKSADAIGGLLRKGREVLVEGRIHTRSYKTDDGVEKAITEVIADHVQLCGPRPTDQATPVTAGGRAEFDDSDDDPLPF